MVTFEADGHDHTPEGAWSVMIIGRATVVTDPQRIRELDALRIKPWTPVMRGCYVSIRIGTISGRRGPDA